MHDQVIAVIKGNLMRAQQVQAAMLARSSDASVNTVDIDLIGSFAL